MPKKHQFEALEVCDEKFDKYLDQNLGMYDFEKIGDNFNVFVCFKALAEYQKICQKNVDNWSVKDSKVFVDFVEKMVTKMEKS